MLWANMRNLSLFVFHSCCSVSQCTRCLSLTFFNSFLHHLADSFEAGGFHSYHNTSCRWGWGGYLCHLLWELDKCRAAPSLSSALWTSVWVHLHWPVVTGTGRKVSTGKQGHAASWTLEDKKGKCIFSCFFNLLFFLNFFSFFFIFFTSRHLLLHSIVPSSFGIPPPHLHECHWVILYHSGLLQLMGSLFTDKMKIRFLILNKNSLLEAIFVSSIEQSASDLYKHNLVLILKCDFCSSIVFRCWNIGAQTHTGPVKIPLFSENVF